jgi:hypothetical protein
MKKYIAKSDVSINVVLASGANRHVSFDAVTGGGSVFYTDDVELQKAIESHYKFGKLFRIDETFGKEPATKSAKTAKADTTAETTTATEDDSDNAANNTLQVVHVTDADDAKAYLAEHFGLSRTQLKSLTKIKDAATANGIVFEGI